MSIPDNIQPYISPPDVNAPIETTDDVILTNVPLGQEQDTIESSQEQLVALYSLLMNLIAGQPQLFQPSQEGDGSMSIEESTQTFLSQLGLQGGATSSTNAEVIQFLLTQNQKINELGSDILSKWNESIKELAKEIEERVNSLEYLAKQDETKVSRVDKEEAVTEAQAKDTSIEGAVAQANQRLEMVEDSKKAMPAYPAIGAAILVTVPLTADSVPINPLARDEALITTVDSKTHIAETTMTDAANQLNPELRPDLLSQLGALVAAPLYQTVINEAIGAMGKKGQADLYAQAQAFSRETLKLITKEGALEALLAPYLKNLPTKSTKGSDVITQKDFVALNRLILSMIALGLLVKAKRGAKKFDDADFQKMSDLIQNALAAPEDTELYAALKGEEDDLTRSLLTVIVSQIRVLRGHPQLPGIIERVLQYLQDGPDPQKMFQPTQVLRETLKSNIHNYEKPQKG